jgi:hypothetical protein
MTVLNRRLYDNVVTFVDGLSGANVIGVDVTKPNGVITLAISGNVAGDNIKIGAGSPEGSVSARIGTVYQRTDGGAGTSLYIKESGSGNTGWTAVSTGGSSLTGGIARRSAIWGSTNSLSASHIITEGQDDLTIRGTTIMTTAKGTGEIWTALRINDGMSGGVNATGDYPGSRILYESDPTAFNPYRGSIDFGVQDPGMDALSRMTLYTQFAYYEPMVPGISIIGGRPDQFGSAVIIKAQDRINFRSDAFQVSGNSYFSDSITTKGAYISHLPLGGDTGLEINALDAAGTATYQARLHYYRSDFVAPNYANTVTLNTGTTATRVMITTQQNPFTSIPNVVFGQGARSLFGTFADNGVDTVQVSGTMSSFNLKRGTGSPESVVTANVGTIYQRTDGAAGTTIYVKESGSGNTGWTAVSGGTTGSVAGVGIANRAAIWGSTNSLSASSKIFETDTGVMISGGFSSPFINPVRNNEIIGLGAGNISMVGSNNVFIGRSVGSSASTSNNNVAIGSNALANGALADDNVAIGRLAMFLYRGNGGSNVAIGSSALQSLTTGTGNIAIGVNAGVNLTADFNNILLGGYVDSGNSNIAIGGGQSGTGAGSNNLYFGISAGPNGFTGEMTDYANNLWLGGYTTTNRIKRVFFNGNVAAIPMGIELYAAGGSGVNISGSDFAIHGGRASGAAQGGRILLKVGTPGSTGSDINPYQTALVVTSGANILVGTTVDNSVDKLQVSGSAGISGNLVSRNWKRGNGSPESVVTGDVGDVYQRIDGSAGTTFYVKESGVGNTGWTAISAGSTGGVTGSGSDTGIAYFTGGNTITSGTALRLSSDYARVRIGPAATDDGSTAFTVSGNVRLEGFNLFLSTSSSTPTDIGTSLTGRRIRMYSDAPNNRNVIDSVGTGSPALHITPSAGTQVILGTTANSSSYKFQVTGKSYFSNSVVIGTTADNSIDKLQVTGSVGISGSMTLNGSNLVNYTSSIVTISGTQFTFDATSHNRRTIEFTSSNDVLAIIPSTLPKGFGCDIVQSGAGSVYVSAGPNTTLINREGNYRVAGQNGVAQLTVTGNTNGSSATARFFGETKPYIGLKWDKGLAYAPGLNVAGVAYDSVNNRFAAVLSAASFGLSGSLLSSEDGITWTGRSAPLSSGGWSGIAAGGGLFVTISGTQNPRLAYSTDGINWASVTSPNVSAQSYAAITYGGGKFVAISSNTPYPVVSSSDAINWTSSTTGVAGIAWTGVAYGNGVYVACANGGTSPRLMYSSDAVTWNSATTIPVTSAWANVAYGSGLFVAINGSTSEIGKTIVTSPDGNIWTLRNNIPGCGWKGLTYGIDRFGQGRFIAACATSISNPKYITSIDGITWTPIFGNNTDGATNAGLTFGQNKFVGCGNGSGQEAFTYSN